MRKGLVSPFMHVLNYLLLFRHGYETTVGPSFPPAIPSSYRPSFLQGYSIGLA